MTNKQPKKQSKEQKDKKTEVLKNKETKKEAKMLEIRPGMTIRVYQKIKEKGAKDKDKDKEKERIQVFEGIVLAKKHGKESGATITVRKISHGVGVEKIFPIFSPLISKIEVVKKAKVRRAKLYYLRNYKKKLREEKI